MVIVAQLTLEDASRFERNAALLDRQGLCASFEVRAWHGLAPALVVGDDGVPLPAHELATAVRNCSILHVYGETLAPATARGLTIPYVASQRPGRQRWPWRRVPPPATVLSPIGEKNVPEAVHPRYFLSRNSKGTPSSMRRVGTYLGARPHIRGICEETYRRLERFRDDVEWEVFENEPEPEQIQSVDVWVDPATEEDFDGMVAEAIASAVPVVASQTAINIVRLAGGDAGFLVPRDPNELAHAILNALFKPELVVPKQRHALLQATHFQISHRVESLTKIYRSILA